ncbi:MAG: hypothetical protein QGH23_01245, partial [Dehalococcoidia bacterium]|nr:hypothetical protein [Dehalococcoidia bacterium]
MPKKATTTRQPLPRWRSALLALLLTAFLASLFVFGKTITAFLSDVGSYLWNAGIWLLGLFGVVPAVIALVILVFLAFKGWVILLRRWHRLMGLIVLTLALAGLLSFIRPTSGFFQERPVAGALGKLIIGDNVALGVLRVVVLTYLGLLLLSPGVTTSRSRAAMKIAGKGVGRVSTGVAALMIAAVRAGTALLRNLTRRIQAAPRSIRGTRTPEGRDIPPPVESPNYMESPPHIEPAQTLPPVVPPATPARPAAPSPPQDEENIVREYRPQVTEPAKPAEATTPPQQEQPIITPSGWQLPTPAILDPVVSTTIGPG